MLYSEFINGTGCRDTEYNFKVYLNLDILYMNSSLTKDEIYEYGKKLVDNSKSEAELRAEQEVKENINRLKEWRKHDKEMMDMYTNFIADSGMDSPETVKEWKRMKAFYRKSYNANGAKIRWLRSTLANGR